MTILKPSKRYALRVQVTPTVVMSFTDHALERMKERDVELETLVERLRGRPLSRYRRAGVIVDSRRWSNGNYLLTVITVWNP